MAKDSRSLEMELRNAKPGEDGKPSIIFIGDGLQLWTSRNRAGKVTKTWVLRYYDALGVECQHVVHPPFIFEAGGFLPRAV